MLPTFQLFHRTIAMYGLMIIIGVIAGVTVASLRAKKYNISRDDVLFASCYAGIGLMIGAKLFYLITVLPELIEYRQQLFSNITLLLATLTGGFVFYGGLIGAVIGYYLYCKKYHIKMIELLDLMAPSIPLIHGFGRIGCFSAGCCYGIPYDGPFHVIFHISPVAPAGIPLLPVQLIESSFNFIAFPVLLIYAKPIRSSGKVIGFYLIYYSILRFILEYLRGDSARGSFFGFSTSQWISIALLPIGLWIYNGAKAVRFHLSK